MVLYASSLASPYALSYASPVRYASAFASPVRYAGYGYPAYAGYAGAGYLGSSVYASAYNPWGYSSLYY